MAKDMKIDFVSDIVCPWCVIGLRALEQALSNIRDILKADIHFQPFELDPTMRKGGENMLEYLGKKYDRSAEQTTVAQAAIISRADEVGFNMIRDSETRIYNTFDAHRLLHWAEGGGRQTALKYALFDAYFTDRQALDEPDALIAVARKAGLDAQKAREVLESGRYSDEVRAAERKWREAGISSVPAIIINDKYLISGGQPAETFERTLRKIASEITS